MACCAAQHWPPPARPCQRVPQPASPRPPFRARPRTGWASPRSGRGRTARAPRARLPARRRSRALTDGRRAPGRMGRCGRRAASGVQLLARGSRRIASVASGYPLRGNMLSKFCMPLCRNASWALRPSPKLQAPCGPMGGAGRGRSQCGAGAGAGGAALPRAAPSAASVRANGAAQDGKERAAGCGAGGARAARRGGAGAGGAAWPCGPIARLRTVVMHRDNNLHLFCQATLVNLALRLLVFMGYFFLLVFFCPPPYPPSPPLSRCFSVVHSAAPLHRPSTNARSPF